MSTVTSSAPAIAELRDGIEQRARPSWSPNHSRSLGRRAARRAVVRRPTARWPTEARRGRVGGVAPCGVKIETQSSDAHAGTTPAVLSRPRVGFSPTMP